MYILVHVHSMTVIVLLLVHAIKTPPRRATTNTYTCNYSPPPQAGS